MSIERTIKKTIEEHNLIAAGDSILVALSGGPDSVALLTALVNIRPKLKLKLSALYINHQIRPQAAKKEELFCERLCKEQKVQFLTVSENIPELAKKLKKGLEETGRNFRYRKFAEIASELKCNKIALGHHVDDRVETILFRLLRGTGRTGLKGIPVKREIFIRPLYDVRKDEILGYLKKNRIKFCVDSSNSKVEFKRNFIRNELLPLIRKELNANVDSALLNLCETIAPEETFLDSIVENAYEKTASFTPAGKLVIALKPFSGYDLWVQRRLLRRCVALASGSHSYPDKVTIDRVFEVVVGKKSAVSIPSGIECKKAAEKLYIVKKKRLSFAKTLEMSGSTIVEKVGIKIRTSRLNSIPGDFKRKRRSRNVIVDLEKISGKLTVRNIKDGDKFQPLGMKGTKKVGDYLTDRKVNTIVRDEIPVLSDSKGIIWLAGYEIDERVKVNGNTKEVLSIELDNIS